MEVIKKGRKQKGWTKQYTCTGKGNKDGGCGAKLLVSAPDIFISGFIGNYREESTPCFSFKCPECEVVTDINVDDIPNERREKLLTDKRDAKPGY